jgi:RNA polymerase sigma-70 factor (ECF subfamily)
VSHALPQDWYITIYDEHRAAVFARALKLLRNRGEAEDLTHEVFLDAMRRNDYDPARGTVISYLMIKTEGLAIDRFRRMRTRKQLKDDQVDVFEIDIPDTRRDALTRLGNHQEVVRAWDTLTPAEKKVMRLFFFQGYDFDEIAERLELSRVTVKNYYVRGMERMRKHFFGELKTEWPGRIRVASKSYQTVEPK